MENTGSSPEKPKRMPPNAGKGRPKGAPNKSTTAAREAIASLVDESAPMLREWLAEIAEEHGKLVAWKCVMDVIEYHIPKLQRTEHAGGITVTNIHQELSALNKRANGPE